MSLVLLISFCCSLVMSLVFSGVDRNDTCICLVFVKGSLVMMLCSWLGVCIIIGMLKLNWCRSLCLRIECSEVVEWWEDE